MVGKKCRILFSFVLCFLKLISLLPSSFNNCSLHIMPFNKSIPKNELSLPIKSSKEDLDLKKQEKIRFIIVRFSLHVIILHFGSSSNLLVKKFTVKHLNNNLSVCGKMNFLHINMIIRRQHGPQLHTRIFLAETDGHNLIEGELEPSQIPTKFNPRLTHKFLYDLLLK